MQDPVSCNCMQYLLSFSMYGTVDANINSDYRGLRTRKLTVHHWNSSSFTVTNKTMLKVAMLQLPADARM